MTVKSKIAFGASSAVESAKEQGVIDAGDILLLDSDTTPKIGWITPTGNTVVIENAGADLSELEAEVDEINTNVAGLGENISEINTEVDALSESMATHVSEANAAFEATNAEVAKKADESSVAVTYERVKFEIADAPIGTLVDMDHEKEIRVMCPSNAVWTKQAVGEGGDPNSYYITLKTYAPDGVTGYLETLAGNPDESVSTDLKEDAYGRMYQPTWLPVAVYDESSDSWNYYGSMSSENAYIGWDYRIDWYKDDVIVQSDSVRINLSNEDCHGNIKPSYVSEIITEMKTYCDTAIAEAAGKIEVVEF